MTRRSKIIIGLVAGPVVVAGLVVGAAFLSPVQTMVARKVLSGQGEVQKVSAGLDGARIEGFVFNQPGLKVVVPSLEVRVPVVGAAGGKIEVGSLVARDIEVEFDPVAFAAGSASKPAAAPEPTKPFAGIFNLVELPPGLKVDGLDLGGTVRLAGATPLKARFSLAGGGVASGGTGNLKLVLDADAGANGTVKSTLELNPTLGATGQLQSVGLAVQALAQGGMLPAPAELRINAKIAREAAGESYTLQLAKGEKVLVDLATGWAPGTGLQPGKWKLALDSAEVRPFLPAETKLPDVSLAGEGALRASGGNRARMDGVLRVDVTQLEDAGLPALGPVFANLSFDVEASDAETRIHALKLDLESAGTPVFSVQTKQAFGVVPQPFALRPTDAKTALIEARLLGVPALWIKTFVPDLTVNGPITAAFTARPEGDGVVVDSSSPVAIPAFRFGPAGASLAAIDSVQLDRIHAAYSASGLVAEIGSLQVVAGDAKLVTGNIAVKQPAGQPLRAQSSLRLALAAITNQPVLKGLTRLSAGDATLRLDAMVGDTLTAKADWNVTGLRAAGVGDLPALALTLDATRTSDGSLKVVLPLEVNNAATKRKSDLRVEASLTPGKPTSRLDAKLTSAVLHTPDLQAFAALAADSAPKPAATAVKPAASVTTTAATPVATAQPLWAGYAGELQLDLARIVHAPGLEASARGRVALTTDAAALDQIRLLLGTGGSLEVGGKLAWDQTAKGYSLSADVAGKDVAVGPLLKALDPTTPPALDGTYALTAKVVGAGSDPSAAVSAADAEIKLEGRAGVVRAINLDTNKYARAANTLGNAAGLIALVGGATGNTKVAEKAAMVAALNDITRKFANLAYDQISLIARRSASGAVEIEQLKLQSPDMLLDGSGGLRAVAGRSLIELPLSLKLDLGARGDFASKLEALHLLSSAAADADTAAFRTLKDPVLLDGTLEKIGTDQLTRLLSRALGE